MELGIEAAENKDGKPMSSKKVPKSKVEECLASVIKVNTLVNGIPNGTLTPDNWLELSRNRIMRLYFTEMIERGCQDVVHSRITSDTTKLRQFTTSEKLKLLEEKLYDEASIQNIDIV